MLKLQIVYVRLCLSCKNVRFHHRGTKCGMLCKSRKSQTYALGHFLPDVRPRRLPSRATTLSVRNMTSLCVSLFLVTRNYNGLNFGFLLCTPICPPLLAELCIKHLVSDCGGCLRRSACRYGSPSLRWSPEEVVGLWTSTPE